MIEKIEPIPKNIPEPLRLAAIQQNLIPFIGAGVSQLGGCPSWSDLASAALKFLVEKKVLNHAQMTQILDLPTTRIKLSVAMELAKQHNYSIDFKKLLTPSETKKKIGDEVYANLSRLATSFVTTNYDDWLDHNFPEPFQADESAISESVPRGASRHCFYKRKDISVENLDVPNTVFHIHGSFNDQDNMVLRTVDYLKCYSSHRIDGKENHENAFLTFLETIFKSKNVLFIGYSLDEMEVLEYIIQKGVQKPKTDEQPRHYVLQGFFTRDLELVRSLELYYNGFGIGLLPFSRDDRDWEQLSAVIEYYAREIPPGPPLALQKRIEMEELLS
jgi:hypothetical protein